MNKVYILPPENSFYGDSVIYISSEEDTENCVRLAPAPYTIRVFSFGDDIDPQWYVEYIAL